MVWKWEEENDRGGLSFTIEIQTFTNTPPNNATVQSVSKSLIYLVNSILAKRLMR